MGIGLGGQHTILISGWAAIVAARRRWYFSAVQVIFVIVKNGVSGCSSSFTLTKGIRGIEGRLWGSVYQYWIVLKIQSGEFRLDLWKL